MRDFFVFGHPHLAPDENGLAIQRGVGTRTLTLEELRAMVGALDPDVLAAEGDVDRTLIVLALERSPLERVRFAQQMLETLMSFKRVEPSGL
jgi:hypothetical protein